MTQFFLDTSSHNLVISIYKNGELLYELIEDANNKISSTLLTKIDEAFKAVKMLPQDIDEIYVVSGPGSFTGIRIGLTFAKVLAYSLNKKIVTLSGLELLASGSDKKYIVPLIDARRGYVYAGMYDKNLKNIIVDKYINLDDLLNEIKKSYRLEDVLFVTYDSFENIDTEKPVLDIKKVILNHKDDLGINPHLANPNYLKKTEAEEKNDKRSN